MNEEDDMTTRAIQGKLIILGESAVGKTSLRRRYMGKGFVASHLMTLGADFASKEIIMEGEMQKNFKLQIWDIAGQDSFKMIRARFLQKSDAAFFVFDLSRDTTFQYLQKWIEELVLFNKEKRVPVLFIGNKVDLIEVNQKTDQKYAKYVNELVKRYNIKPLGILYTSAKTGENVNNAFQMIVKEIYRTRKDT